MIRLLVYTRMVAAFLLIWLLTACQAMPTPTQTNTAEPAKQSATVAPEQAADPVQASVDAELLYAYLVGEIGARSGQLDTALEHYMQVLQETDDAYAAARATRIALHLEDYETGLSAANRWLAIEPDSLVAHRFTAILYLRTGQLVQAQNQLDKLLSLAETTDESSLLLVVDALRTEPDQAEVLQVVRNMLAERPQDAQAWYAVAVVEAGQQKHQAAEQSLRQATVLKPDWPLPHKLLAQQLAAQGKEAQALAYLDKIIRTYPDEAGLRHTYARQLVEAERFAAALDQFRHLYQQDTQDIDVAYGLAILLTQQEEWEEARPLWQKLRNQRKFHAEATYFLGRVEEATEHTDAAIALYQSVQPSRRRVDAIVRASTLLAKNAQLEQARKLLKALRAQYPQRSVDIYLAEAQLLIEQTDDAAAILALYAEALEAHPQDNDLQYARGLYFANQKLYAEMEADFSAILQRDAGHVQTLNAFGYTLADRNIRLQEALGYIQRALAQKPDHAAILDSMGWLQYRLGNLQKAETYLRRALESMQDDEIAAHLGEVLWMRGKQAEARKIWRQALQAKPDSEFIPPVLQRLGVDL